MASWFTPDPAGPAPTAASQVPNPGVPPPAFPQGFGPLPQSQGPLLPAFQPATPAAPSGSSWFPAAQNLAVPGAVALAPGAMPRPPVPPHGVGGFLSNLWHDAESFATGIGGLLTAGVHDAAKAITEGVTLGHGMSGGYDLAAIARAAPGAIASDYASRYGSVSGFEHGLYTHPLAFLTDILALGTAGGTVAAKGAFLAGRGTEVAAAASDAISLAQQGSHALQMAGEAAASGDAELADGLFAKSQEFNDAAAAKRAAIPAWINHVLPNLGDPGFEGGYKWVMQGNNVVKTPLSVNPLKRLIVQEPLERLITKPLDEFQAQADALRSRAALEDPTFRGDAERLETKIALAKRYGMTSLDRPAAETLRLRSAASTIFGLHAASWLKTRNQALMAVDEIAKGLTPSMRESLGYEINRAEFLDPLKADDLLVGSPAPLDTLTPEQKGRILSASGVEVGPDGLPTGTNPEVEQDALNKAQQNIFRVLAQRGTLPETKFVRALSPGDRTALILTNPRVADELLGLPLYQTTTAPIDAEGYTEALRQRAMTDQEAIKGYVGQWVYRGPQERAGRAFQTLMNQAPQEIQDAFRRLSILSPKARSLLDTGTFNAKQSVVDEYDKLLRAEHPEMFSTTTTEIHAPEVPFEQTRVGRPMPIDVAPATSPEKELDKPVVPPEVVSSEAASAQEQLKELYGKEAVLGAHEPDLFMGNSKADHVIGLQIPTWSDVGQTRDALAALGDVTRVDSFADSPTNIGYRGMHVDVMRPNGTILQVRLQTPLMRRYMDAVKTPNLRLADFLSIKTAAEKVLADPEAKDAAIAHAEQALEKANEQIAHGVPLLRGLAEPVIQEMESHLLGKVIDPVAAARENYRLLVQSQFENAGLQTGKLSMKQALERNYLVRRMVMGATYDPRTGDFLGGPSALELARRDQIAGFHQPFYMPLRDRYRLKDSEFLLSRRLVGSRVMAGEPYYKRATGNLFQMGRYVLDPTEVYRRRAAEAIRHAETWAWGNHLVTNFGRPVDDRITQIGKGETLVALDGLNRMFRTRIALQDALLHATAGAAKDDEALHAALTEVMPHIQDEVINSMGMTTRGLNFYAVPKTIARYIEADTRRAFGSQVKVFWDTPTNLWRSMVLTGSPRWVVNNLLGNIAFLKMQGGRFSDVIRLLDKQWRERVDTALPEGIKESLHGGLYQSDYTAMRGSITSESRVAQIQDSLGKTRIVRAAKSYGNWVRQLNSSMEDLFRTASYLKATEKELISRGVLSTWRSFWTSKDTLDRIAEHGLDDAFARKGINQVNYFFNDYRKMSPVGRQIIRPYIAPFFSFYRHVARLLVTYPFTHPARADLLAGLAHTTNDLLAGYGQVPDWMKGDVPIGPGRFNGDTRFLNSAGANPFNTLFGSPLSILHPAWRVALEEITGRSTLTGQEFTAPDVVAPFGSPYRFRVNAQGNATPVQQVAPSILEDIFRQIPQYQLAEQAAAGGRYYDTANLLSLLTQSHTPGGPVEMTPTGQTKYPYNMLQRVGGLFGFPTVDFNVPAYQAKIATGEQQGLLEYLRSIGQIAPATPRTAAAAGSGSWFG